MTLLLVAVAGGAGASARFLLDTLVSRHHRLSVPLGTAVVNLTACFLLGLLTGWLTTRTGDDTLGPVLGVGFLGGYSTFSTASVEAARLVLAGRTGAAVVHAAGMLVASLGAAALGLVVGAA